MQLPKITNFLKHIGLHELALCVRSECLPLRERKRDFPDTICFCQAAKINSLAYAISLVDFQILDKILAMTSKVYIKNKSGCIKSILHYFTGQLMICLAVFTIGMVH
jgi:hypothetical protein